MVVIIDGVRVEMPKKLEPRMIEVGELVGMVNKLAKKQNKSVNEIHVWETKRHELCYADFTKRPEPIRLETHNSSGVPVESEEKMDLHLSERRTALEALESSLLVLSMEKACVERQYDGKCDNKRDCANCDLALDREDILKGYDRAIKCVKHVIDLVCEL